MSDKISKKQHHNLPSQINGQIITQAYTGPLPPASEFEKYNMVVPDAGSRILAMAENEAAHRHSIQNQIIKNDSRDSLLGIVFAFILSLGCLIVGAHIILALPNNIGAIIAGAMFGLSGIFSVIKSMIEYNKKIVNDSL